MHTPDSTLYQRYSDHYKPLIKDFIREVDSLPIRDEDRLPGPFLPRFGKGYVSSALKLVIVGQDDHNSWNLWRFIAGEKAEPGKILQEELKTFRLHLFTQGGSRRQTFWGFTMMFLAALHGRKEDWEKMKKGELSEILDSFAWGNIHAIALPSSIKKLGIPSYWDLVRRAGNRFNGFQHIQNTLHPRVVVVTCRGIDIPTYCKGYDVVKVLSVGRLTHYKLPKVCVDIFQVPHPRRMRNGLENPDYFCDKLKTLLVQNSV